MRRYWQRKPLLVRGAFATFVDPMSPREVLALAASDEASARLVQRRGARWILEHGPIPPARIKQLPRRDWTVLVQDTNHFSAASQGLLDAFTFIPHARVDDLMVSYAVPGGGVGPHVDSYDVFLVQGHGRRRWQVSTQSDVGYVPGLPLKILERFRPEQEWVLEAGDMLYLPPGVAHHGVAESECLTWSVGLRAPSDGEIVSGFLDHLQESLATGAGHYRDAGAGIARHRGEIPPALVAHAGAALRSIRWKEHDVGEFMGRYLTEPKAHVYFTPPRPALSLARFARRGARLGVALDLKSRLMFSGRMFYMNGEALLPPREARTALRLLADRRLLPGPLVAGAAFWALAHTWYLQGFAKLNDGEEGP